MMGDGGPVWSRLLRARPWLAVVVVTALTLVLIGGVIVATTNLGCGSAKQLGINLVKCATPTGNTAARNSPPPLVFPSPTRAEFSPGPNPVTSYPPQNNPGSYYPPDVAAGSSGQLPRDPFFPATTGTSSSVGNPGFPNLSCTLPVFVGPPGSGGFISFPSGSFTADPRSAVSLPSPGVQQGPGYGYGYQTGMTYDRAHSRWLPVGYLFVSPDGNHYAFASGSGIYVVNASNSSQVELGQGHQWVILNVLDDRVLATVGGAPGFWVLPFSGAPVQVVTTGYWQAANDTAAFGTATSAVPSGTTQQLIKLDISTAKTSDWFSLPNGNLNVVGFDTHGNPLVQVGYPAGYNAWELWVTTGANQGFVLLNNNEGVNASGPFVADAHGLWFAVNALYGGTSGLALYIEGSAIFEMNAIGANIAGGCA